MYRLTDTIRSRARGIAALLSVIIATGLAGCASQVPGRDQPRREFVGPAPHAPSVLLNPFVADGDAHPGQSGFRILSNGTDGFAVRMQLLRSATSTLDIQYYIFSADSTGTLIAAEILAAADRGVRVRLLVDDAQQTDSRQSLIALSAHENIQVRLFNPLAYRGGSTFLRSLEFVVHFPRLDFRMHNKLMVADKSVAIAGGRNVGDPYFQVDPSGQVADDDVFVAGPAVGALSATFEEFWSSPLSVGVEALIPHPALKTRLGHRRTELGAATRLGAEGREPYFERAESGEPLAGILAGSLPLVWAPARVIFDSPDKKNVVAGVAAGRLMYEPIAAAARASNVELLMVTPYFIPTAAERQLLTSLRQRNVSVRILTNSLESTTELTAHSGYVRFRPGLLRDGVDLYEVKALIGNTRGSGQTKQMSRFGNYGLHGKLIVFDDARVFIGSMNFDQRSRKLNTEIGVIIDSPTLAQETKRRFVAMTQPENAYHLEYSATEPRHERLMWCTSEAGVRTCLEHEPSRSFLRHWAVEFLRILPLDSEL